MTLFGLIAAALFVGVIALAATLYSLFDALQDVEAINERGIGNGRRRFAYAAVRREWVRLLGQQLPYVILTWTLLGIVDRGDNSPPAWAVRVLALFLVGQVSIATNSLLDVRLWRRLRSDR